MAGSSARFYTPQTFPPGTDDIVTGPVSDTHDSEHERHFSEAKLQALLDAAVDAIIVIDSTGRIETVNASALRLFGYCLAEVVGRNVNILMPEPYHQAHDGYLRNYLTSRQARIIGIGREVSARRKDGSVFPISLAVGEAPFGKDRRFVGIIRDLSAQKRAEAELRQAELEARQQRERLAHVSRLSTLGEMATGIAHEINQPLTAIATYAQACHRLIANGQAEPAELMTVLEKVVAQTQRAGEVIRRLRNLVKRRDSEKLVIDCNELIADTARLADADARIHDQELCLDLHPGLLTVAVDPIQLQQVVLNLVHNGLEAMSSVGQRHGQVRITSALTDSGDVEIAVYDQGPGVKEHQVENLFVPFYTTKHTGLGIGLSISRSIVRAHGGELQYRRNAEGGAIFAFTLPHLIGDDSHEP